MDEDERRRRVRVVFYGTNDRNVFREASTDDAWNAGPDNIEHFRWSGSLSSISRRVNDPE